MRTAAEAGSQAGNGAPRGAGQHSEAAPGLPQEHYRVVAGNLTCAWATTGEDAPCIRPQDA